MKTRRLVLLFSIILCLCMLVACSAEVAEQKAEEQLAYATFKNDAKDFSISYDGYKSFDELFWYYKANKLDAYGKTGDTGEYYAKVPGNTQTGKGLDGKTEALSEGKWQFTLMAFEKALTATSTDPDRYNADESSASAIYSGSTPASGDDVIVIRRNQTNYIPVTVTPVAGTGHIKFADAFYAWEDAGSESNPDVKITINLSATIDEQPVVYEVTKVLSYGTLNYPISGYIWVNGSTGTIDTNPVSGYSNEIPAGVYAASIVITPVDNEDNIIFADQNLSLKVFGGLTATISGSLKELLSTENYFAVPEVDVKVFNPNPTSEEGTKVTSDYVAKDVKENNQKTTITFEQGALTSTNQHSLEVEVFSAAVSESKFEATSGSQAVAGLDLTLKKVTRTSEGAVTEETVEEFENSKYATIVTYINPGLEDVVVKYNGTGKDQPIASDTADTNVAAILNNDEQAAGNLGYNPTTGYLSFKTNHFSEYYVEAKVYVQNVTTGKYYHSLQAAVDDAKDNQTIKLLDNIELTETLTSSKSFELDLNGNNISANNCRALYIKEGIVSILGNGTISANGEGLNPDSSVIRLGSPALVSNAAKLTIGAGVTVSSNKSYGITVFGYNVNDSSVGQELIVDGNVTVTGQNPAISGNGSSGLSKTKITINAGATVSSTGVDTEGRGSAIYHPQAGTLLINGGTVSGPSAIEAKGGDVTIIGGEIQATASSVVHELNSNGNSTAGYSIVAVKNGDYKGDGNYVISNGNFTGRVAVVEDSEAEFSPTISITGGIFNYDPSAYVARGYCAKEDIPETGLWTVSKRTTGVAMIVGGNFDGSDLYFDSLQDAINAAYPEETIKIIEDITDTTHPSADTTVFIAINKDITIDGDNHKIESNAGRTICITDSSIEVCLKNLTVKNTETLSGGYPRGIQVNPNVENVKLTIDNCEVSAKYYAINFCSGTSVNVYIKNSISTGWSALNIWSGGVFVEAEDCTFSSESISPNEKFGTIVLEGDSTEQTDMHASNMAVNFTRCTIKAKSTGYSQPLIQFNNSLYNGAENNAITLDGCTLVSDVQAVGSVGDSPLYLIIFDGGTDNNVVFEDITFNGSSNIGLYSIWSGKGICACVISEE